MQFEVGQIFEGKVTGITKFGAFISLPESKTGMVHISEVASTFVKEIREHLTENQTVKVKIIGIDPSGRISLSIKQVNPPTKSSGIRPANIDWNRERTDKLPFEDMLNKFKQDSDEKMTDLKRSFESKRGAFTKKNTSGK